MRVPSDAEVASRDASPLFTKAPRLARDSSPAPASAADRCARAVLAGSGDERDPRILGEQARHAAVSRGTLRERPRRSIKWALLGSPGALHAFLCNGVLSDGLYSFVGRISGTDRDGTVLHEADVAIFDFHDLGPGRSLGLLHTVAASHHHLGRVVLLRMRSFTAYALAYGRGAHACVDLNLEPATIRDAVSCAASGQTIVPRPIAPHLGQPSRNRSAVLSLTPREIEVGALIARGHRNAQIARRLGLRSKTVTTYRARALEKLGVTSDIQLAELFRDHGLTSSDDLHGKG